MGTPRIGFIGFGEVGKTFAREMQSRGAEVSYYDVVSQEPEDWAAPLPLEELVRRCEVLLSTVPSHLALQVAREAVPYLHAGKMYADMNSTSAAVKREIAAIIAPSRATFIEGAILSAVGEAGARAAILVSGEQAEEFARLMNRLGLVNVQYFLPRIGEASLVKMIRSVFSKGVECLLLEMLSAAKRAGVEDHLWKDIVDFMTRHSFDKVAENWIRTHPLAVERRYHEMVQVVETLEEIGIEPLMTRATRDFFQRSRQMRLGDHFAGKPASIREVTHLLERELGRRG
jgi:3-hydroxyisobutyrate dehydrogenase-like beta-hydroxyacid dehydrogenase